MYFVKDVVKISRVLSFYSPVKMPVAVAKNYTRNVSVSLAGLDLSSLFGGSSGSGGGGGGNTLCTNLVEINMDGQPTGTEIALTPECNVYNIATPEGAYYGRLPLVSSCGGLHLYFGKLTTTGTFTIRVQPGEAINNSIDDSIVMDELGDHVHLVSHGVLGWYVY